MRKLLFATMIIILLSPSCRQMPDLKNTIDKESSSIAKVLEHRVVNNKAITIVFNETVEIIDIEFENEKLDYHNIASIFTIQLPRPLSRGEKATFSITVKKMNGNTTRASFLLIGENEDIPMMLINEISIAGNKQNPDRIELIALEDGNTAGMTVKDKYKEKGGHSYTLPELDVKKGDIIVIYWDRRSGKQDEMRKNGRMTYYLDANSTTLSSTKGLLVLLENPKSDVMDAVIYCSDRSESFSGFGSEKLEAEAMELMKDGQWDSAAVDSSLVTSSRVLARLPGYIDQDISDDWFTTIARGSTFGDENIHAPYEEE